MIGSIAQTPAAEGPLAERVYRELKDEIEFLLLAPGAALREQDLARRFGVSRTPVRDALRWLEAEGLVETVGRRTTLVANVSLREAFEAYEIRELIEPFAAAEAARTRQCRPEIAAMLDRLDRLAEEPADAAGRAEREEIDRTFHALIAEAAGNQMIGKVVAAMRSRMRRVFVRAGQGGGYSRGRQEHRDILTAILDGDAARAEEAMRAHLRSSKTRLMQFRPEPGA